MQFINLHSCVSPLHLPGPVIARLKKGHGKVSNPLCSLGSHKSKTSIASKNIHPRLQD